MYVKTMRSMVLAVAFISGAAWAAPEAAKRVSTVVVRVPSASVVSASALRIVPEKAYDYGSFQWLELSADEFKRLENSNIEFRVERDPFTIRLGETSFDPRESAPSLPDEWKLNDTAGPDLHLVQFDGPPRQEWLDNLERQNLKIVQYIHPRTYVVWGEMADRAALETVEPSVRWSGNFEPGFRVLPRWHNLDGRGQDAKVMLFRGADTNAALDAIAALGGQVMGRRNINDTFEVVSVTLPGSKFNAAGKVPGVYSVQVTPTDGGLRGELSDQINVNNVDGSNAAFPGYQAWLATVGLDGSGVIMANVDGGIYDTHPDLVNRMLSCSGSTCGGGAVDSHGTHTAAIMAGDGASGTTDGAGFLRGLGMAPGANLVEQVYSPTFTQPGGMLTLMYQSFSNGAVLSGNSWGPSGSPQGYDNDTMQVDQGVRDADPNAPGNQQFTYVLSFMNGNGGTSSQGTPDEAKNLFNIGSTKAQNGNLTQILDIDDISANSAHGPALDGRTIPHMVAPGCSVDSPDSASGYGTKCGTSMASPHVSGAVGLFFEYYRNLPSAPPDPSPALVKAAFLPVARDLAGNNDADGGILGHRFDSKQGWGRMDVEAVIDPQLAVRYFDDPQVFDNTGEEWSVTVSPEDPSEPMKIMLVWTDAVGHGLGGSTPAWNNDLDLVVEAGASTYLGNVFGGSGWSVTGGAADFRNNTEGVLLGPTSPGAATIRVVAADINSDGIPGTGDGTDQDFALVCYNCAEEPGFTLTPSPGTIEICAPDDALYSIDVGQILGFTDPVTLSASGLPAGTNASFSTNPVVAPDSSDLTISGTGAAASGSYTIGIDGNAPSLLRSTSVTLDLFVGVPGTTVQLTPADGAGDTSLTPEFSWTAATSASGYVLEVATDPAFTNIVLQESGLADTSFRPETALTTVTTYYWRVRPGNICGDGGDSATFSFTTRDIPAVLLVDDDDNSPDVRSTFTNALDAIGQDYDIWDTNNTDNEPLAADLAQYRIVIWFTGDEFGGAAGPGAAGEAALGTYLDGGNCLFVSSQEYYFDRGLTAFMQQYLGVQSVTSDVTHSSVTGAGTVYSGFGPYSLVYPFTNYSDRVNPDASAETAFAGSAGSAAVAKDSGTYRTTFWGFPFVSVASASDREALMTNTIDWCLGSLVAPPLSVDSLTRNRYIKFIPNNGINVASYQVELGTSDTYPGATMAKWVGVPDNDGMAPLSDTQVSRIWREGVISVADCGVIPASTYLVRSTLNGIDFSDPLVLTTTPKPGESKHWGDCVGIFDGAVWAPANGTINIDDVVAAIQTFQEVASAPPADWTDVHPEQPNLLVNFADVQFLLLAFQGEVYPFSSPESCP